MWPQYWCALSLEQMVWDTYMVFGAVLSNTCSDVTIWWYNTNNRSVCFFQLWWIKTHLMMMNWIELIWRFSSFLRALSLTCLYWNLAYCYGWNFVSTFSIRLTGIEKMWNEHIKVPLLILLLHNNSYNGLTNMRGVGRLNMDAWFSSIWKVAALRTKY